MEYRILGRTGLRVSALGFGCSRIAGGDHKQIRVTLDSAFENGINFFDTANSWDHEERMLGQWMQGKRDRIVLCSKAGYRAWQLLEIDRYFPSIGRIIRRKKKSSGGSHKKVVSSRNYLPGYLRLGIEGSLRRLKTNYLDLFYLHSPSSEVLSNDAVLDTLDRLRQEGMIRFYGVSFPDSAATDDVRPAISQSRFSVLQFPVYPESGVRLESILPEITDAKIGTVGRSPFRRGAVFSSKVRAPELLRNVLQQPGIDVVLVGMTQQKHLIENLTALR